MSCLDTSLLCLHRVMPRLHSEARLRSCHHALLTVVHTPKAVKLSKVHIGLNTAVFPRWKRVSRSGAEEAPSELELLLCVCVLVDCRVRVGLWLHKRGGNQSGVAASGTSTSNLVTQLAL